MAGPTRRQAVGAAANADDVPRLTLVIANKNYSSWSLRPWLAMRALDIPFAERMVKFDSADWARNIAALSPTGLVPVLWEEAAGRRFATFDSIAILERLHELHPDAGIWPAAPFARARARSLAADFHAGCQPLRAAMPMNIRSRHPGKGTNDEVREDVRRLAGLWAATCREFGAGGPFLFGAFSAADAFFAPVASRFVTYGVELQGESKRWQEAVLGLPAMREWTAAALREREFVPMDEPYADPP